MVHTKLKDGVYRFRSFMNNAQFSCKNYTISNRSIVLIVCMMFWKLGHCSYSTRNNTESAELVTNYESSLSLPDILPIPSKQYDKNRAPKLLGQPTVVYFHVTVLSLDSINEESMTYVTDIFLAQSWRDPRLRLPENMSEEYRILDVDWLHSIWRPDCFFKNAKKVTFHEMTIPNHYLWLYHDKTLLYMSKLTLVLSCAMKFESYPHDTQICSMMIESLSHTVQDLVFIWNMTDPLVVNSEIELPQLDISNNYTTDCTIEYSTGNFTCLAVVFNLRRRLGYHLFHTYIPSALIVVMSWISFWIKPEAIPARVTLGVTSLLTLATQNTQSQQSLPPVSYVKAIDVWMSSCSVFVFLSLMEFAVVNNYMGPVATKAMKGYSDEDLAEADDLKIFAICAFATTTNFSVTVSVQCQEISGDYTFDYPFSIDERICVNASDPKSGHPISGNLSSDSQFFVATGVLSLMYCIFIIAVYAMFDELYRSKNEIPLADFMLTTILAIFWLSGSAAWSNGSTALKGMTDATMLEKACDCQPISVSSFSRLNISLILGFLNFFLWASDLWFLYKETIWFQGRTATQAAGGDPGIAGAPGV